MNLVWHLMVLYSLFIADTVGNGCPAGFKGTNCHQQNIALNKPAFQSNTYGQYHASLAVDGNTDTDVEKGHCSHTGNTPNAYWTVILNDTMPYNISQFTLYLRNKGADRYMNLRILVDGHSCQNISISGGSGPPSPNPVNGQCDQTLTGNNVSVHVDNAYLTLCEVQIWGTVGIECPAGFKGTTCHKQNIALSKSATQSGILEGKHARLAVDGNTDTHYNKGSCSHTDSTENAYWTVILDNKIQYNITQFTLYLRDAYADRYKNLRILVEGILCKNIPISGDKIEEPSPNPVTGQCNQTLKGNKVTVRVDNAYLTLCEVQIWVCSDGWFGVDCENVCKCLNTSETCDKETGYCRSGCARGWQGNSCQTDCPDGFFGNCSQRCNCRNSTEICNKTTGECYHSGCKIGTYEPDCQTDCRNNTYGFNCTSSCGHCKNSVNCDPGTGVCSGGCEASWKTEKCDKVCDVGFYGNCSSKCGHCQSNDSCDKVNGSCSNGCQDGYITPLCQAETVSAPGNPPSVAWMVGGVVAAVVVLLAVGLVAMFLLRRRRAKQGGQQGKHIVDNSQLPNQEDANEIDRPQASPVNDNPDEVLDHYYNNIPANIPLDFLKEHVRKNIAHGGFESEYQMIRYGFHGNHEIGKRKENKPRNRYRDLLPYDHTRVRLVPDGASTWDYINASFVSGHSDDTTFIAAQGPNPVTVDDFWRMVWQHNVRKIVMLTRLVEINKKKCEQYWPEGNEAMQCGNITIHTTLSTVRADFTIRKFKIQHTNSPKRTVTQFHFTTWPDHGVPAAPALVGFWKQVKLTDTQTDEEAGPVAVHCSAGVGRTGTFIALDSLVTQAETENKVNVFMFVAKMREARMNMVQTEKQYQFVYEALVEALESRGTFYTLSEFDLMYGNDRTYTLRQKEELRGQFKSLQTLKTDLSERLVSDSLLPENVKKNRSEEILPPNRSRPFLMTTASGCNDYINAVMLPSAIRSNFYIVTQTPLPETVVDFWRLVYDHDCYIIVCLDDSKDAISLYPREMTSSTVGPFNVETQSELRTRDNYVFMKMTISHKNEGDSKREIEVYRFAAMDTTSGHLDSGAILEFINDLQNNSIGDDQKMLIHCFDGSRVSGVFCSIMNIVSRLRLDKEVDIFLTIRELQTVRPQFVQTYEQYKSCHDMVKEYSRSSNIYANM